MLQGLLSCHSFMRIYLHEAFEQRQRSRGSLWYDTPQSNWIILWQFDVETRSQLVAL